VPGGGIEPLMGFFDFSSASLTEIPFMLLGTNDVLGAGRGNRTPMVSPPRDFESRASTNSAIPAMARIIREMSRHGNLDDISRLREC
jgi:hypothetical protein